MSSTPQRPRPEEAQPKGSRRDGSLPDGARRKASRQRAAQPEDSRGRAGQPEDSRGRAGQPEGSRRQAARKDEPTADQATSAAQDSSSFGDGQDRTEPGGLGPGEPGSASDGWQRQMSGLGAFIRMQRRLADLSLREMANLTSVSNAYLSQIERGLHQPSLRVLRSIAQALSIAPEDLLRRANFMLSRDDEGAGPRHDTALPDTEAAIKADPRLTPAQRDALLNVYRSFRNPT